MRDLNNAHRATVAGLDALLALPVPALRWRGPLLAPDEKRGGGGDVPLRILMVEDDVALAMMYATRFRRDGHQVTTVHDGEEGLKQALGGDFDLVFLDIGLPKLDGISVLQQMRASETAAQRPVVILSNYNEPPLMARGKELGVRHYLVKSEVSPAQLAANLREWADN
jgi:DNA-binding response OmpR family regulator